MCHRDWPWIGTDMYTMNCSTITHFPSSFCRLQQQGTTAHRLSRHWECYQLCQWNHHNHGHCRPQWNRGQLVCSEEASRGRSTSGELGGRRTSRRGQWRDQIETKTSTLTIMCLQYIVGGLSEQHDLCVCTCTAQQSCTDLLFPHYLWLCVCLCMLYDTG